MSLKFPLAWQMIDSEPLMKKPLLQAKLSILPYWIGAGTVLFGPSKYLPLTGGGTTAHKIPRMLQFKNQLNSILFN